MSAWMFLQRFPTPHILEKAGKRQWEKFLHSRRLWHTESGPQRMELFSKATEFCGSEPTAKAKSMLALSLVKMLFALENQLSEYRKRIEELFEFHPDHDLFGSLPSAGPKLAPRLLGEIGDDRERFESDGAWWVPGLVSAAACCSDPYFDFPFFQSAILRQDQNGRIITNRQSLQRHR